MGVNGEKKKKKTLEMHKHIRLMCGTSLHIQSCCAFCLQGSAEAEAFKSHMIYYTAKCKRGGGGQMKAVFDGGLGEEGR